MGSAIARRSGLDQRRDVGVTMQFQPKALAEAIAPVIQAQLNKRDARLAELEGRIARLERLIAGEKKAVEWPLPTQRASERAAA